MSDGVIDQIKQKLDILEVLGDYIRLAKAGRNYKARCPFHAEKTASFMASPERQIWHCFGCGLGGDIFGFVMKIEGVEFGDALRILAKKAGVILKKQDPQIQSQKKRLYEICELAAKFFETQLTKTSAGKKAHEYLIGRGMKPAAIKEWRLGWAHDEWRALSDFLKSRGYREEEMLSAGLSIKPEENSTNNYKLKTKNCYDRFRSRIIFPIFDSQGQVIAFGGRIFGEAAKNKDMAKYLNSPQTPLYDKSNVLYGLNKAKNEIRQKDQCIIVEGYMDLIMSHQAGSANVVASSGTALTENHLSIIGRYTKNLSMAFDADEAGGLATRRSIELALRRDFNVKVIVMEDKDPADIVKKDPEEWLKAINKAQSVMDFYFNRAFAKYDGKSPDGKREIRKMLLAAIKSLASKTEQSEWIKELAGRLRSDERDLLADMGKIKIDATENTESLPAAPAAVKSRLEGLEERFLGLYLSSPGHFAGIDIDENDFQDKHFSRIFKEIKRISGADKNGGLIASLQKALEPELKIKIDYLLLQVEQHERSEKEIIAEIASCATELKLLGLKNKLAVLSFDIKDAQRTKDKSKLEKLLNKFREVSIELTKITAG